MLGYSVLSRGLSRLLCRAFLLASYLSRSMKCLYIVLLLCPLLCFADSGSITNNPPPSGGGGLEVIGEFNTRVDDLKNEIKNLKILTAEDLEKKLKPLIDSFNELLDFIDTLPTEYQDTLTSVLLPLFDEVNFAVDAFHSEYSLCTEHIQDRLLDIYIYVSGLSSLVDSIKTTLDNFTVFNYEDVLSRIEQDLQSILEHEYCNCDCSSASDFYNGFWDNLGYWGDYWGWGGGGGGGGGGGDYTGGSCNYEYSDIENLIDNYFGSWRSWFEGTFQNDYGQYIMPFFQSFKDIGSQSIELNYLDVSLPLGGVDSDSRVTDFVNDSSRSISGGDFFSLCRSYFEVRGQQQEDIKRTLISLYSHFHGDEFKEEKEEMKQKAENAEGEAQQYLQDIQNSVDMSSLKFYEDSKDFFSASSLSSLSGSLPNELNLGSIPFGSVVPGMNDYHVVIQTASWSTFFNFCRSCFTVLYWGVVGLFVWSLFLLFRSYGFKFLKVLGSVLNW